MVRLKRNGKKNAGGRGGEAEGESGFGRFDPGSSHSIHFGKANGESKEK